MAALLGRWLREVCELDREIESLDHELSCGGLVANVLLKKGVVKSSEVSSVRFSEDPEQRATNWFTLDALLQKKLGLNLDPGMISGVILEHAGAAAKLALELKCKLEPETVPFKKKLEARKQRDELFVAKKSVVAKPVPAKAIENLVRGRLGQKEGEMALHMARFENVRIKREEALIEQGALEAVQVAMAMDDVRERAIQKLRENRAFLNDWTEKQAKSWRKNQRVKRDRIRTQLSFELTCRARKQAKENKERIDHASQVHWSTTAFEKNLKRLGLEGTEERGEKFEQMAEGFQERHLQDLEKAFAAMSTESAQLMARLHRQEVEGVDARRQREQRRRKLNCDNVKVQKQVEAARDKGAQIARMLGQAHIERESAATARRKRQQIALRAEAGRRFADLMTIERDAAFKRAMLKDREFLKQSRHDLIKAAEAPDVVSQKLDGRKSRNNVTSASSTQNTKKVKHYNTAQDTVDLVVGLALEVCDLRAENHRAKLKTNVWRNMKRAFVNGSDKLRDPTKRLFEQLVSPVKESHGFSLEEDARSFCEGLANLCPDPVRLSQTTLDDLCQEHDQVKLGRPCLTKGALVIVGMSPLCASICTRLSFGLSLEVLSVQQYLDEVKAHLQSLQEDENSDPECHATKESKGSKGQQGGKKSNKGAKLDLTTILSREELVSMLAEVPEENRREAPELARLVAIDLAENFKGKAVILNQIIATKEQAQIIEYLQLDLEERASLSFDAFVKLESSSDEPRRATCLLAGILVGDLGTVNNESLTTLAGWLTSHTAVLPVDHVDAEEPKTIADAIELVVPFVIENVAQCESPEDLAFGLSLVRAQQEGLALPEGVQPLLNLTELDNVQATLLSVQELFERRCTSAAVKLAQLRRQIHDIVKGMYQDGIHLLRGGSVTPDIQQLSEWFRQAQEQVKDVFAMDDLVTGLGQHLWTEALEKSLAATEEFSKWKAKDWVSSLSDCISAVFIELVDAELLYYTEARSCLKEYHAAVEPLARVVNSRKASVEQALKNRVKLSEVGNEHNQSTDLEGTTEDPEFAQNSSPDKGDFSVIDSNLESSRNETQKEPSTAKSSNSEDENQCIRNNSSLEGLCMKQEAKDSEEARSHDLISFEELVLPDVGESLLRKAKQALRSISLRESRGECDAVGTSSMAELNVHFRARVRGELEEASRMFEACQFAFDTLFVELEKAMRARIIVEDSSIRTFTNALTCAIRTQEQPSEWLQSTIAHLDAPDGLPETLLLPNNSS